MIIEFTPGNIPKNKEALKDIILEAAKKISKQPQTVNAVRQDEVITTNKGQQLS